MALNPVATGILTGAISGAAMGFLLGGPAGAAVGLGAGAAMGAASGSEAQKKDLAARAAYKDQYQAGVSNENRLMMTEYNKKLQARGLGEMASSAGAAAGPANGIQAAQQGSVLSSNPNQKASII